MLKFNKARVKKTLRAVEARHNEQIVAAINHYLENGFRVVPLYGVRFRVDANKKVIIDGCSCKKGKNCSSPGKHPLKAWHPGRDGKYGLASPDWIQKEFVNTFFYKTPVNIAVATGYGFVVVDVDSEEALQTLFENYPVFKTIFEAARTSVVKTGKGYHFYVKWEDDELKNAVRILPGVDVKTTGGYVVAPPSIHASGVRYKTLEGQYPVPYEPTEEAEKDLAKFFEDVKALQRGDSNYDLDADYAYFKDYTSNFTQEITDPSILRARVDRYVRNYVCEFVNNEYVIPEGTRNNSLTRAAGYLRWLGASPQVMLTLLKEINERYVRPPLPIGEVNSIVKSISRKPIGSGFLKVLAGGPSAASELDSKGSLLLEYEIATTDGLRKIMMSLSTQGGYEYYVWNAEKKVWSGPIEKSTVKSKVLNYFSKRLRKDPALNQFLSQIKGKISPNVADDIATRILDHDHFKVSQELLNSPKPGTVNTKNGVVNLTQAVRPGELKLEIHDPLKHYYVVSAERPYVPLNFKSADPDWEEIEREVPQFAKFLKEFACGDTEYAKYILKVFGYALLGEPFERKIFFLYGYGANGKTALMSIISQVVGEYFAVIPRTAFYDSKARSSENYSLAMLKHKRIYNISETSQQDPIDAALIKQLTAGVGAKMTVRQIYAKPETIYIEGVPFVDTNFLPRLKEADRALWDRIVVLPAKNYVPPEKQDPTLVDRIVAQEGDKIFSLLLWFAHLVFQNRGLGQAPEAVKQAIKEYRSKEDPLYDFVQDCVEFTGNPNDYVSRNEIYEAYQKYCEVNGLRAVSKNTFVTYFPRYGKVDEVDGTVVGERRNKKFYLCVRLKDIPDDGDEQPKDGGNTPPEPELPKIEPPKQPEPPAPPMMAKPKEQPKLAEPKQKQVIKQPQTGQQLTFMAQPRQPKKEANMSKISRQREEEGEMRLEDIPPQYRAYLERLAEPFTLEEAWQDPELRSYYIAQVKKWQSQTHSFRGRIEGNKYINPKGQVFELADPHEGLPPEEDPWDF